MEVRERGSPGTDRDLVIAFQNGDDDAYEVLYRRHARRISRLCLRYLRNPSDAEEATQETFMRVYQALHRFNGDYRVAAWLNRVATNVCLDRLRAIARAPVLVGFPRESEVTSGAPSPESIVVEADVSATLNKLRPMHAHALHLRALEGLSYKEIGTRLAISPAQVKSLLHRARSSLRSARRAVEGLIPLGALLRDVRFVEGARTVVERGVVAAAVALTVAGGAAPDSEPRNEPPAQTEKGAERAPKGLSDPSTKAGTPTSRSRSDTSKGEVDRAIVAPAPALESQSVPALPTPSNTQSRAPLSDAAETVPRVTQAAKGVVTETTETLEEAVPALLERLRRGTSNE